MLGDRKVHSLPPQSRAVDIAIVGAGFAGLSAAWRLHELNPSLRILVLEARRVGEGPAGRNSGFMIDLPHHLSSSDYAGEQERDRVQTQMNRRAIAFARRLAQELSMTAGIVSADGKVNAAATARGDAHNRRYVEHLAKLNEPYEWLDQKAMQALCGSGYYRSGVYTPGTLMLQPAAYVRALADGLRARGVTVAEQSPVTALKRAGSVWSLRVDSEHVRAKQVILANNGHVESFGQFRGRLMHVLLFASMSDPLDPDTARKLGGEARWGLTPSDPFGSTLRRVETASGSRVLIRNGMRWTPERKSNAAVSARMCRVHQRSFDARFPQLQGLDLPHRWGGLLCLSRNGAPAYGEIGPDLYAACCQNGLGTVMGTLQGLGLAERLLGVDSELDAWLSTSGSPSPLPPEPFLSLGARVRLWQGEWSARAER